MLMITRTPTADPDGDSDVDGHASPPVPVQFFPLTWCRVVDTQRRGWDVRGAGAGGRSRHRGSFVLASQCGVPSTARAVAISLTVTLSSAP